MRRLIGFKGFAKKANLSPGYLYILAMDKKDFVPVEERGPRNASLFDPEAVDLWIRTRVDRRRKEWRDRHKRKPRKRVAA